MVGECACYSCPDTAKDIPPTVQTITYHMVRHVGIYVFSKVNVQFLRILAALKEEFPAVEVQGL